MRVQLAYGRDGLTVDLPTDVRVIVSSSAPSVNDETQTLRAALRYPIGSAPLATKVKLGDKVVITHSDITRATPNDRILPILLAELEAAGVRRDDITLLNALGTHRKQTPDELRRLLGDVVFDNYRCLQHDAFDEANLVPLGATSRGHPVRINRAYMEANVRILTGFIEPHFFAGYSGGPKAVLPALSGWESVFTNHGYAMLADANATWTELDKNPIWREMAEVAQRTNPTFLLNVTLNAQHEITGVFAGDLLDAHRVGCEFVREHNMVEVDELFDIVITTNSGYPLDQNLYQTVKGMSAAARIVREGGAIIMAAGCEDGVPNHGKYAELLRRGGSPQGVLDMVAAPGFSAHDQWQVQLQAIIQLKADVYVYSDGLTDEQIAEALFIPCRDIEATVASLLDRYGPDARIAVLPEGPQTVAYLHHGKMTSELSNHCD